MSAKYLNQAHVFMTAFIKNTLRAARNASLFK